jgi:hypothetical protein
MRETVRQNGVESGIAEEDLDDTFGGRIFPKDSFDLFPNGSKHGAKNSFTAETQRRGGKPDCRMLGCGPRVSGFQWCFDGQKPRLESAEVA